MLPLDITHVSKRFVTKKADVVANDNVSFRIEPGHIHGLLGPNGAGKSTLINMITGVLRPDSGNIRVFSVDVVADGERAKQMIGAVPQEIVSDMAFTVSEVLYYHAGLYGVSANDRHMRIKAILSDLQLEEKANERARNLSGGMKRRLMIAKALLHKPRLLILDEPTAGVDVALRQKIWELVRRINKEDGTTILFTTHYLEEAEQLCERITLINHGIVIKEGSMKELQREFSQNVIHFELFNRDVPHLPGVREAGVEYEYPMTNLEADLQSIVRHYDGNLKSIRNEAASLESIFLTLTK